MKFASVSDFQALGGRLKGATIGRIPRKVATTDEVKVPAFSIIGGDGLDGLYRPASMGLHPPFPVRGASSLREVLSMTGMDVSFLRVLPGDETPFAMRHRKNEVVYIVAEGRGEFLVDGEVVEVEGGSILRVSPSARRAWRNTSSADLCLIVVQARARRPEPARRSDAIGQPGLVRWWRRAE